ncbi:MAG: hypothetical protein EXR55_03675 [Dehalococcoidia bacterium]|nr:hypothetical protein [Dehalococcoidia bacterium]
MVGRVVKGALLGFAVMLLAALPPIIHFVTGPHLLGSFLGGFVGGAKARATRDVALGIGALMGLLVLLPGALLVLLLSTVFNLIAADDRGFYEILVVGVSLWVATLGALGAWVGGHFSLRASRKPPSVLSRAL